MSLTILIAPSGFKESLSAEEVADCIETGLLRAAPQMRVLKAPLVDGGEGFTKTLVAVTDGSLHEVTVTGPTNQPVKAYFGFLGGEEPRTAVLEMAAAAGLRLVPRDARNPLATTTYGVGELIRATLDAGAERLLIGCGDSGTSDGGAGMAQALGVGLLDKDGKALARGGEALAELDRIDLSGLDPRAKRLTIDVAVNWTNVLCGQKGVARVFGPQKGASPAAVEGLAAALDHYADIIERDLGIDVRTMPGSGASGGLGTGLHAFLGANLRPRFEIIMQYLNFDAWLDETDLVITAEGALDAQTPRGKIPAEVARRAKERDLPVVALAGTLGQDYQVNYTQGIDGCMSILRAPCKLSEAIEHADTLLTECAENIARILMVGRDLGKVTEG